MSIKEIHRREYRCNACNFTIEVNVNERPTKSQTTGRLDFIHGAAHASFDSFWLCEDCTKILDRFLCGDLRLDEDSKQFALLDDRFNDWWTEYCRMESALKMLGHKIDTIKDGTSVLVGKGFRKEDIT